MFALVDCNNFYASCERVFQPKLRNKPIVVLSNNDGCVIARSNEAKKLGVPMGAVAFEYRELFEKNNIHVFSSNYALYGDMSNRVMTLLGDFSPDVEVYSIDEAFLKLEGFEKYFDFNEYGKQMRETVTTGTGIPISVGIAPTKSLAKVANKIAKKFPERTENVYVMDTEEKRIKALKWLPVEDVWGVGRQHKIRLEKLGVKTAYDFTCQTEEWVKKNMSVVGLRLHKELNGESCLDIDLPSDKKNIATTRSFDSTHEDIEYLKERVVTYTTICAKKLRKQGSCANSLMVFAHTNRFRDDLPQYSKSCVIKLPFPTNSDIEIAKFAVQALEKIYKKGYQYKKAGVILMDFTPESNIQINMFENSNPKHKIAMGVLDKINDSIGKVTVKLGSQDKDRTWKMRQEKLSPRYTTRINELIKIRS